MTFKKTHERNYTFSVLREVIKPLLQVQPIQVQFMLPSNKTSITCAYINPTININNKAKQSS